MKKLYLLLLAFLPVFALAQSPGDRRWRKRAKEINHTKYIKCNINL